MIVGELKEILKDIPDHLPVVVSQNDNPDMIIVNGFQIRKGIPVSDIGFDVPLFKDYDNKNGVDVFEIG